MPNINILTTNTYKVLSLMYDKRDKDNAVYITQKEIADELDLNKSTINLMIKALRENGYITQDDGHMGRYALTNAGVKTIVLFRKSEK